MGVRVAPGLAFISALTVALPAMAKNLALEVAPIRVNVIAAGFVDAPLSAELLGDELDARREQLRTTLPIRRVIGPVDIAALAIHLMTNTAVTGAPLRHRRRPATRRGVTGEARAPQRRAATRPISRR